jgi:hypothetical protein
LLKTTDLARMTGYSARQIQRMAECIPGVTSTEGGWRYAFKPCPELSKWVAEHKLRDSAKGMHGRKSSEDFQATRQRATTPPGMSTEMANELEQSQALLKLAADKVSPLIPTMGVREKQRLLSDMRPIIKLAIDLNLALTRRKIVPRRSYSMGVFKMLFG